LPAIEAPEVFKSDYDFNFLDFKTGDKEKLLENLIVSNIEAFLKELGEDFAFISRQRRNFLRYRRIRTENFYCHL
jgi:predicted nuclease of restriction endonuclease-like (RecB) superfamily